MMQVCAPDDRRLRAAETCREGPPPEDRESQVNDYSKAEVRTKKNPRAHGRNQEDFGEVENEVERGF